METHFRHLRHPMNTYYAVFSKHRGLNISLLIKCCLETNQTQTGPNKSKPGINVSKPVTHLLLAGGVKMLSL